MKCRAGTSMQPGPNFRQIRRQNFRRRSKISVGQNFLQRPMESGFWRGWGHRLVTIL
jgi:hypothetical protein